MLILKFEQYVAPGSPNENFTIVVKQINNKNFHPDTNNKNFHPNTGLPFFVGQTIYVPNGTSSTDPPNPGPGTQENKITSIDYDKDDKHCS